MKFKIEVTETLRAVVEVEAKDLSDAICKVGAEYVKGGTVLDSMDYIGFSIKEAGSECKQIS